MHELSIAQEVIRQVEETARRENARKVLTVTLTIGRWSGVDSESLAFVFPLAAEGTSVEGARLSIDEVPARVSCLECHKESEPAMPLLTCDHCGSRNVQAVAGRELFIKSVEIES